MKKNSEEAFLFSTFREFNKCWRSGTKARVIMESLGGHVFVNFSAFLGYPDNDHFQQSPTERKPTGKTKKKSARKIKRDNDRAARFNERKRREEEAASATSPEVLEQSSPGAVSAPKHAGNSEADVSSTPSSESVMTVSDIEFSFASPVPEILRTDTEQDTSMIDSMNIMNRVGNADNSTIDYETTDDQHTPITQYEEELDEYISDKLNIVIIDGKKPQIEHNCIEEKEEERQFDIDVLIDSDIHDDVESCLKESCPGVDELKEQGIQLYKLFKREGFSDGEIQIEYEFNQSKNRKIGGKKGHRRIDVLIKSLYHRTSESLGVHTGKLKGGLEKILRDEHPWENLELKRSVLSSIDKIKEQGSNLLEYFKKEELVDNAFSIMISDCEYEYISENEDED